MKQPTLDFFEFNSLASPILATPVPLEAVICGIDEAGRGPLAGPVTAAAVVLPRDFPKEILKDSKKLSPTARKEICLLIMQKCSYGVGWAWPLEIDTLNIHHATLLAMQRAFAELKAGFAQGSQPPDTGFAPEKIDITLVDGLFIPQIDCKAEAVVKGDNKVDEIKAASIIAKTVRDLWMLRYSWIEPAYLFEKHKGYPTPAHKQIIKEIGFSPIHRKTFKAD
ncbi:MAG: ribonuclease HII [Spirochaetes bacterium]|nr:ribonuclease HII [Spirochaetota bacterium]